MDAEGAGGGVIRGAPPGNRPGESREDELAHCVPERAGQPHVWEIEMTADRKPTGKMFCLWCGKKALMKRSVGMFVQTPLCARTGY